MRPFFLLATALSVIGCTSTVAPVVPLPPPRVEAAPAPAPEPIAVEVETVQGPVSPPPTPERRIARRSTYTQAQATEWVLENDLTVVYVQQPVDTYHAHLIAPTGWMGLPEAERPAFAHIGDARWGPLVGRLGPGERVATGSADTLGELVDAVRAVFTDAPDTVEPFDGAAQASPRWGVIQPENRADGGARQVAQAFGQPEAFTVFIVGSIGPEWVEPVVAERLFARRGGGPLFQAATSSATGDGPGRGASPGFVSEWDVPATWDDLPAVRVLDAVLAARAAQERAGAAVTFDAGRGTVRLRLTGTGSGEPILRAPITAAEGEAARRRATADAATGPGQAQAFAELWALSGRFRPARQPDDAATLPAAIARMPIDRADDLLRRLLASPRTAGLGILTPPSNTP